MRKTLLSIVSILLITVSFTACGVDAKWNQPDPNLPGELVEKYELSIETQLAILEEDPSNIDAHFEIGFNYDSLGNFKKAVESYEKVLELDPLHFPALNNMATIYETVEEYDKAAEYIKRLYESNPSDGAVLDDTVRILLKADLPDDATAALENFASLTIDNGQDNSEFISRLFESIRNHKNSQ